MMKNQDLCGREKTLMGESENWWLIGNTHGQCSSLGQGGPLGLLAGTRVKTHETHTLELLFWDSWEISVSFFGSK